MLEMLTEFEDDSDEQRGIHNLQRQPRNSLEGFGDKDGALSVWFFRNLKDGTLEDWLDPYYVRDLLKRVPKMVARTVKLSSVIPQKTPSSAANLNLREATRSYIYGFWQASVALSTVRTAQRVSQARGDRETTNCEPCVGILFPKRQGRLNS